VELCNEDREIALLRISLGVIFLGFGVLKFVPGLSPAEDLAADTMRVLTLGLLPTGIGLVLAATLETAIGLLLITGRYLRLGLGLLAMARTLCCWPRCSWWRPVLPRHPR
jgi:putative oxidoreductase